MKKMQTQKIAIPTMENGLDAQICDYFGNSSQFLIIEYNFTTKEVGKIIVMKNSPQGNGGSMRSVLLLKEMGITKIILTRIGQRPLLGFNQQRIAVLHGLKGTIRQNLDALGKNELPALTQSIHNPFE